MEIYDISVKDINGENVSLERYRGKVLLKLFPFQLIYLKLKKVRK